MVRVVYSDHLGLSGFDHLSTPMWVFDVDRHCIWWANARALELLDAATLDDLTLRDFSTDSDVVRTRLRQIVDNWDGSSRVQDSWTLYPEGEPRTATLSFTPVQIENGRDAVLIEVTRIIKSFEDAEAMRFLEAARSTPIMVSTYCA